MRPVDLVERRRVHVNDELVLDAFGAGSHNTGGVRRSARRREAEGGVGHRAVPQ